MRNLYCFILILQVFSLTQVPISAQTLKLEKIKSYPFPSQLVSCSSDSKIAWIFEQKGLRNVYAAEGPDFEPRKITNYNTDDGQEISSLSISPDGKWLVFIRGGDHGSNWNDEDPVNVNSLPLPPQIQITVISFDGKQTHTIGSGGNPVISPKSDKIAFIKHGQAWSAPIDGSSPAKLLFSAKGSTSDLQWSPDASSIAFVSNRQDHAFIGIYTKPDISIRWIAPSFYKDRSPRWSPDGSELTFVRSSGSGGSPDSILSAIHQPWAIWKANVTTAKAQQLWKAPQTLAGSPPTTHGGINLHWAARNRIIFMSYQDGWPHLYSVPSQGGKALLLTPGNFMAEHITLSPDKTYLYFSANTGPEAKDIDRRHIARVPVDKAAMEVITSGTDMQWTPSVTGDGKHLALITTIGQQPPLPAIVALGGLPKYRENLKILAKQNLPADFPTKMLITPQQVIFDAPDGTKIHAQLFIGQGSTAKKPAIVYVHGGPSRQMLLGWNYSDYYSNAYAMNQHLASLGFTVLSVNYRLGIGYGHTFHQAKGGGTKGASEYQDIKAAGLWLAKQNDIDPKRIGIYGGSYGGYLTNLALAKDSKLFAAGVSIHGIGDRTLNRSAPTNYEKPPDVDLAAKVAWESSPIAYLDSWTSPVLLIHGDDDRNVQFSQSTDLNKRLEKRGIPVETLVIPDDTHHWMKYENLMQVNQVTIDFFVKKFKPSQR